MYPFWEQKSKKIVRCDCFSGSFCQRYSGYRGCANTGFYFPVWWTNPSSPPLRPSIPSSVRPFVVLSQFWNKVKIYDCSSVLRQRYCLIFVRLFIRPLPLSVRPSVRPESFFWQVLDEAAIENKRILPESRIFDERSIKMRPLQISLKMSNLRV